MRNRFDDKDKKKQKEKQKQGNRFCGRSLLEPGKIIYKGVTGSLTFLLGGSFTKGSFVNILTGTSGTFISYSFNAGLDVSGGRISGQFRDLASFNGGNDNTFSGVGAGSPEGGIGVASVTSKDLDGNVVGHSDIVGIGTGPATFGSSFSVTEITSIKQKGC